MQTMTALMKILRRFESWMGFSACYYNIIIFPLSCSHCSFYSCSLEWRGVTYYSTQRDHCFCKTFFEFDQGGFFSLVICCDIVVFSFDLEVTCKIIHSSTILQKKKKTGFQMKF